LRGELDRGWNRGKRLIIELEGLSVERKLP
jgi:hypothetical protein